MKNLFQRCTFAFLIILFLAPLSHAFPAHEGQQITFSRGQGGNWAGGEFIISDYLSGQELFRTFCLEKNEYINFTSAFTVADISGYAANGIFPNGTLAQSQLVAAPVPEPATMLLLGTGLIFLASFGKKHLQRQG
jgi:hypothetical protein